MSNKAYMRDFGSKGKIQDGNGIAATLQAAMGEGGGNVPLIVDDTYRNRPPRIYDDKSPSLRATREGLKVMEPIKVGETDSHQKGGVYDPQGICPTLMATGYKQPTQIIEPKILAANNFGHKAGDGMKTRKRTIKDIASTIQAQPGTTQMDYVLEPMTTRGNDIASTIRASIHKQGARNLIENIKNGLGYEGVIEPVKIITANKQGYDEAVDGDGVDLAYPKSKTRRGRVGHGVSKTLATGDTMGVIIASTQAHASVRKDGIVPTLTSAMGQGGGQIPMHNYSYRIRKLTPKECWRLMGFDDTDFEKAEKVNSNTQLYKQAGNSIVVNVLEAILSNLIKEK